MERLKKKEGSYSPDQASSNSEEEKRIDEKKERLERPLKVKLPKGKHSFTVIGTPPLANPLRHHLRRRLTF